MGPTRHADDCRKHAAGFLLMRYYERHCWRRLGALWHLFPATRAQQTPPRESALLRHRLGRDFDASEGIFIISAPRAEGCR